MANTQSQRRKSGLLRKFDKSIERIKPLLASRFDPEQAHLLAGEAHREYENLIPQLPYMGDWNPFTMFMLPTSRYLAMYRILGGHGLTLEEVGQLIYKMGEADLCAIPPVARRLIGYLWFVPFLRNRVKKRAAVSQLRKYPGDFVFSYVEGDGEEFDYGIDYTECANCKFLKDQGAMELAPYACAIDKAAGELLGWGLTRTTTLAEGYEKCDFRFKKGGATKVTLPESLERIL